MAKSFAEILAARKAAMAAGKVEEAAPVAAPVEPEKPTSPFLAKLKQAAASVSVNPEATTVAEEPTKAAPVGEACAGIGKCQDQGCPAHYAAEPEPLPVVITAANLVTSPETQELLAASDEQATMLEIRQRIHLLEAMEGFELKTAMDDLKGLIHANASAFQYMLPEDSGLMVRALRRMTNNAVAASLAATPSKAKAQKTASDKALLANVNAEEW